MKLRNYGYRVMRAETETESDEDNKCFEKVAWVLAWCLVVITFPFSLCFCLHLAKEYERIVIFRLGRVRDSYGPGLVFVLPCVELAVVIDIRTDVVDVEPQDMLTKDSVTISVSAVVYFCIYSPVDSIINVDDAMEATERLSQVTLRNTVGSKALHELLVSRQALSLEIQRTVAPITAHWGVRVERVDIMEISLPSSLERSLASEAEAVREARAKIILAEGEAKASKALKEASDVMSQNCITLQLRHLQVLSTLATERRVNFIFPIPLAIMEPFLEEKDDGDDDYSGYFTPKLYIEGPPPDDFYDPEETDPETDSFKDPNPDPSTQEKQPQAESETTEKAETATVGTDKGVVDDPKTSETWRLPAFFRQKQGSEADRPSTSKQSKQAPQKRPKASVESEPYPLLPSNSAPSRPPRSRSSELPPIPPPPTMPPIPNPPPPPPPKPPASPESQDKKVFKPDRNYYF